MSELKAVQNFTQAEQSNARSLDDDIRTAVAELRARWDDLQELLVRAQSSGVHIILGYRSWTAYVHDVFGETGPIKLDKADKTEAIVKMTDELGMPARAIAAVLGVSAQTVARVALANGAGNKQITGMNGHIYMPSALRKRKAVPPPVKLATPEITVIDSEDHQDDDEPPQDENRKGGLMHEAKRLNTVLNAVASELAQLEQDRRFRERRRYVMAELRPGIVRLFEQVQGMSSE